VQSDAAPAKSMYTPVHSRSRVHGAAGLSQDSEPQTSIEIRDRISAQAPLSALLPRLAVDA
jgi:hypothetical protein